MEEVRTSRGRGSRVPISWGRNGTGRFRAARLLFAQTSLLPKVRQLSKTVERVLTATVAIQLGSNWFSRGSEGQPACKSYVPISWGELVNSSQDYGVVIGDNSGTPRLETNLRCETTLPLALGIRRGIWMRPLRPCVANHAPQE